MVENEKQVLSDEQALQDFLLDIKCLDELLPWTNKFNMFDVLKISRTEIRHSNMLGWLFDPNENHGLEDEFLKGILQRIVQNDDLGRYDVFQVLLMDLYSFQIFREWKNIDLLLVSDTEKIVVAIENKVDSREHSNQLNRYREILENDYANYKRILIYLTPYGDEPSDMKHWGILTYSDVVEVLEEIYHRINVKVDVDVMIRNYIEVIRRDIVEDEQLIKICNKIYSKHRKALDLIFNNRVDKKSQTYEAICKTLIQIGEEDKIVYDKDWGNVFRTTKMDQVLPLLEEPKSSWGTEDIYSYWFQWSEDRFYVIFELAGANVPDSSMEAMQRIIDILKPNDKKRDEFTYKRVYRTKWFEVGKTEDIESEVEQQVRSAVDEVLKMEHELLEKL